MTSLLVGFVVTAVVIIGIYWLFVLPGERRYHETKLRLMQERIERHEKGQRSAEESGPAEPPQQGS
ncbi:MAG: hypothetical protein AAGA61_02570 [Pseudomonadota bacterium]